MPKFYDAITPELEEWAQQQPVFWTASAPLVGKHINISPKGLPAASFSILSPNSAAYLDSTGSGSETISHIYENGRITIMFNSFGKSPRILRFFCKGRVIESDNEPEFSTLVKRMGKGSVPKGTRAVIYLDVWKVQTSCGFGVPVANFEEGRFEDRDTLNVWASKMVDKGEMEAYQAIWNVDSLDGLTGLKLARRAKGERFLWLGDLGAWSRKVMGMKDAVGFGMVIGLMTGVASSWLWLSKRFPT